MPRTLRICFRGQASAVAYAVVVRVTPPRVCTCNLRPYIHSIGCDGWAPWPISTKFDSMSALVGRFQFRPIPLEFRQIWARSVNFLAMLANFCYFQSTLLRTRPFFTVFGQTWPNSVHLAKCCPIGRFRTIVRSQPNLANDDQTWSGYHQYWSHFGRI